MNVKIDGLRKGFELMSKVPMLVKFFEKPSPVTIKLSKKLDMNEGCGKAVKTDIR